uniref:NADH dehydrogenase [ubiquinone] 1 alpha subcomplex subunit 7 n=1 Tax=Panagrolaimus sp. PS1159 TaxID=55785 RepID=A0AC35GP67_9BILA
MSTGKKIASAAIKNRKQTPIMSWLRDKLLAVGRRPDQAPPGLPGPDGKFVFNYQNRFPNTQASRSPDPPAIPGGVHHKLADNYYHTRDARHTVEPPPELYKAQEEGSIGTFLDLNSQQPIDKPILGVNHGPSQNFGLKAPTPGFGFEWNRSVQEEQPSQKNDKHLAHAQKFDKYLKLH